MDVSVPLHAAAGAAGVLMAVAVGILVKATTVLENAVEAVRQIGDAASDLRVATAALRGDLAALGLDRPPHLADPLPTGAWPLSIRTKG